MGCCGGGWRHGPEGDEASRQQAGPATEDPLAILKVRLAEGEITVEEYERLVAVLSR